jgi:hypothetical protein
MAFKLRFARWLAIISLALMATGTANARLEVAEPFSDYYHSHQGLRVLGYPLGGLVTFDGHPAQYFEKGRIEDHRGETSDPTWAYMYGRLTAELMEHDPQSSASSTNITYGDLKRWNAPQYMHPAPRDFGGGTTPTEGGVFVPYDPRLRPAAGYIVGNEFWRYINREDLFPGGWLHDIGLPMSNMAAAVVLKNGEVRSIMMQAFERTVLTLDPMNPADWRVERGNIGADAMRANSGDSPEPPGSVAIQVPAAGERVMLPVHILARVGSELPGPLRGVTPGEPVVAVLRWQDGTELTNRLILLRGEDGGGLLIGNLDRINLPQPPEPKTQGATLELRSVTGAVLAHREVTVVSPNDAGTQGIRLYWTVSGTEDIVQPQVRRIIRTERIGAAALEELLWGPPATSQVGFGTAIPTPEQVLSYPGRGADWGPRVTLHGLTIKDGVATADFSKEMQAFGGGSARVKAIRDQVTQTLKQFPGMREVRIAIEGRTEGVLEP